MSHFAVGVVLPKHLTLSDGNETVEAYIAAMLAPFYEGKDVEPYPKECWCRGSVARNRIHRLVEKIHGKWPVHHTNPEGWRECRETYDNYLPYQEDQFDYDPGCEGCKGTGVEYSTYNPQSQWDWYRVGGRWDGEVMGNRQRSDNGFNFDEKHQTLNNNTCKIAALPKMPDEKTFRFFALLTPDGNWIERGNMGWFGMVSDEKDVEQWEQILCGVYERYADNLVVMVDAHI